MTTVSNTDIQQLSSLINNRFDRLQDDIVDLKVSVAKLEEKVVSIDRGLATTNERITEIKTALEDKIDGTNKRVDDINGRLNITTIGFLSIVGVLVTGVLTAVAKIAFFPGNP